MALLEVKNLKVEFDTNDGVIHAVKDLSYTLEKGKTLAIVGESGSGKTQGAFAILGLLPKNGRASGSVMFDGKEILNLPLREINKLRARRIGIIFQDPMTSLNPYLRISRQMTEVLELHKGMSHSAALAESVRFLDAVRIPVIAGIWPLVSVRNAEFLANEVPGVTVPEEIITRMRRANEKSKEHAVAEGIAIAHEMFDRVKDSVQGVQVSAPFGKVDLALQVFERR